MALVDMLGLQSLLKLVCSTIILKICHNFHKVNLKNKIDILRKHFKKESLKYSHARIV